MADPSGVEERLAALEEAVRELRQSLARAPEREDLREAPARQASAPVRVRGLPSHLPGDPPERGGLRLGTAEEWLSRLGIAMLLFGVAFLFKYSIDRGWLTPAVRAAIGHGTGLVLLLAGQRLTRRGRTLGMVLSGGAIATFYVTIFAQFQVLEILSQPAAFVWMSSVTALSFAMALRHDQPLHALIGALGGFGTPFLLYTGSGNVPSLVVWSTIVTTATVAVALWRGWHGLLWVAAAGAWLVLVITLDAPGRPGPGDARAIAAGVAGAGAALWALPLIVRPFRPPAEPAHGAGLDDTVPLVLHSLTISTPLMAGLILDEAFSWSQHQLGWACLAGSALFAAVAWALRAPVSLRPLAPTHALVAVALLTVALACLLDGDVQMLALACEAAVLHGVAGRIGSRRLRGAAHALSAVVALVVLARLLEGSHGTPVLNARALSDLAALAALCVGAASSPTAEGRAGHGVAAHLLALLWCQRELSDLGAGEAWVSGAWAALAAALLVLGLLRDSLRLRQLAMATFGAIAVKILVFDLSRLDPLVRVVTSMGFGVALLGLGYLFPMLWRARSREIGADD